MHELHYTERTCCGVNHIYFQEIIILFSRWFECKSDSRERSKKLNIMSAVKLEIFRSQYERKGSFYLPLIFLYSRKLRFIFTLLYSVGVKKLNSHSKGNIKRIFMT
jgi:hypothetical protein